MSTMPAPKDSRSPLLRTWSLPSPEVLYPVLLLLLNLAVVWRMFSVEYSAYLESNEGTFIAIARQVAARPLDLLWWPLWDGGLPFQNTYLPLLHVLVGGWSALSGQSAALAFHQVCAMFYCVGPVTVYLLARVMTGRAGASFLAGLAYSILSPCAFLAPPIRNDLHGLWNLRRLQILGYYGEGPITASLAFFPLAVLALYLVLTRDDYRLKIAAGVLCAATVLANAFGAVMLAIAAVSLLGTVRTGRLRRNVLVLLAIALVTYCWISPLLPPSVVAAIRQNSPRGYPFTARSLVGVLLLAAGYGCLWCATRKPFWNPALRFFLLFAFLVSGITLLGTLAEIYVVPQPHRYQIAMDMGICLFAAAAAAELAARRVARQAGLIAIIVVVMGAPQIRHSIRYGWGLIRPVRITGTVPYRMARWADRNMDGRRVMISGAYSFYFNDFTDTPQLHGGHDPMQVSPISAIAAYVIYSGMNTGSRDAEISTLWLQALGAHAISVPGPGSAEFYKPFANPRKFDGVLPVLWREGDDVIYGVPARSGSLAHVVPAAAVVRDMPVNGLDTAQIETYVRAINDPALPEASWRWLNWHSAVARADVGPGQALSVQETYTPGWHARVGSTPQRIRGDGLGMIVVHPTCQGPCEIYLWYDGGTELRAALGASFAATFLVVLLGVARIRRRRRVN